MSFIKDLDCTINTPVVLGNPSKKIYGKGIRITPKTDGKKETVYDQKMYLPELLPLEEYDKIIVLLSGGKDSVACLLKLLELGVPKQKIECWHHDIDGGNPVRRMDWPVTQPYVRSLCEALEVPLRVIWRVNGFFGEVYRLGASYPIEYEDHGEIKMCPLTERQKLSHELRAKLLGEYPEPVFEKLKFYGYRMKFPAKAASLERRWCSSILKVSVSDALLRNLEELRNMGSGQLPAKGSIQNGRWCSAELKREVADHVLRTLNEINEIGQQMKLPVKGGCDVGRWCSGHLKAPVENTVATELPRNADNIQILVVSGERRGESAGRSHYNEMEIHRVNATKKAHRLVHQWRCVIDHSEADIWAILKRHGIIPHPCYYAGWSRCSCMMCIFSLPQHWAGIRELFPEDYKQMRQDEIRLGFTLDNKKALDEYVGETPSCVCWENSRAIEQLKSGVFTTADILTEKGVWSYPAGAFHGAGGGPC